MDIQVDRLGKVQTENTHNRFCVDYVSSGYQIKIIIKFCNFVTNDFTLSIEFKEICTVFIVIKPPVICVFVYINHTHFGGDCQA